MKKVIKFLAIILMLAQGAIAQQKYKGKVLAQNGLPIVGATIKGGEITLGHSNVDGAFEIMPTKGIDSIQVSHLNYMTMSFSLSWSGIFEIVMPSKVELLQEIIVNTGYQQLNSAKLTGSVNLIDNQLFNRKVSSGILERLENASVGLIFNRGAGSMTTPFTIRGQSTLFASTSPLIVIDNFPFDGDIQSINPNDIESVSVLKDAAAASIWGVRAGNGVIVITTKKAKYGQQFHLDVGLNTSVSSKTDLMQISRMTSTDYIDIETKLFNSGYYQGTELSVNKTALSPLVEILIAQRDGKLDANLAGVMIGKLMEIDVRKDFQRYFYQRAVNNQYSLNMSGGSHNQQFRLSAGYDQNIGNKIGDGYGRRTVNFSHRYLILDNRLEIGTKLTYAGSNYISNSIGYGSIAMNVGTALYPYALLSGENNEKLSIAKNYRIPYIEEAQRTNGILDWAYRPLQELELADNKFLQDDYRLNADLKYKLIKGFDVSVLYQYSNAFGKRINYFNEQSYYVRDLVNKFTTITSNGVVTRPIPLGGILDQESTSTINQNLRAQLSYNREFVSGHQLDVLGGYEISERNDQGSAKRFYGYDYEHEIGQGVDYSTNFVSFVNPQSKSNRILYNDALTYTTDRFRSSFANLGYSFKDRYRLTGSIRKDEANIFGVNANQRGVPLYSMGAAWALSNESFYHKGILPFLKLRMSYGTNGNVYKSLSAYTTAKYNSGSGTETKLPNAQIINPPNPDLRWEKVKIANFGVDFGFKNNVISGSFEYYSKVGTDLIGDMSIAPSTGLSTFRGNSANTKGNGFDLNLRVNQNLGNFYWSGEVLLSYQCEKVGTYANRRTSANYVSGIGIPLSGNPLFSIYSYPWYGLNGETGDPIGYVDGKLSIDYNKIVAGYTVDNLIYNGSARPTKFGTFRNTFNWKSLELSFALNYRLGYVIRKKSISYGTDYGLNSLHGDYGLRWQMPGDEKNTQIPSIPSVNNLNRSNLYVYSDQLVDRGDHLRFQDINLSYELKGIERYRMGIKSIKIYSYVNNVGLLWVKNKWRIDPDYQDEQPLRTIAFGIKLGI